MSYKKFSAFLEGGNFINTDKAVGLRNGANYKFDLNFQKPTITGYGNPNGAQAGTAGLSLYFDTSLLQLWKCNFTGNSDTAVWESIVGGNDINPGNTFYVSNQIGNDSTGDGSIIFPYKTYDAAVSSALLVATELNPANIFITDIIEISGNIIIYPFVNLNGYNASTSGIKCNGVLTIDSSFNTIDNPSFISTNIGISFSGGVDIQFTISKSSVIIFFNSPIYDTPNVNLVGSDGANSEVFIIIDSLTNRTVPAYSVKNMVCVISNSRASSASIDNTSSTNQSVLILIDNSSPGAIGSIDMEGVSPYIGSVLYCHSSPIDSLIMNGADVTYVTDSISYTPNITFSGGSDFGNVALTTLSDGVVANNNFTPVNYTLPSTPPFYHHNSITNNLSGIDNKLGDVNSELNDLMNPIILYADRFGYGSIIVPGSGDTFLLFPNTMIDTSSSYDGLTSTYTITRNGKYRIDYSLHTTAIGGVTDNLYSPDAAVYKNGVIVDSQYSSNRNPYVANATGVGTNNNGFNIIELLVGDTIQVRLVNNGNIDTALDHACLGIQYISA